MPGAYGAYGRPDGFFASAGNIFVSKPLRVAVSFPPDERNVWLADLNKDEKQDLVIQLGSTGHVPDAPHRVITLIARQARSSTLSKGVAPNLPGKCGVSGYSTSTSLPKSPASFQPRSFSSPGANSEPINSSRSSLPSLSQ